MIIQNPVTKLASSNGVSRCSRLSGVDLVLARTDSSRRSAASSKLDCLRYHRETAACSSNDMHWQEKNKTNHSTDYYALSCKEIFHLQRLHCMFEQDFVEQVSISSHWLQ